MTFGSITLNNTARYSSVDAASIQKFTQQILEKAETKSVGLEKFDLSKFKKPEIGVDLYNTKTSQEAAQQISIRNAGLDINLNQNFVANIQYLNTQAAKAAFEAPKNSAEEGKIQLQLNDRDSNISLREVFSLPKSTFVISTQNSDKDKKGSNPFSYSGIYLKESMKKNQEIQNSTQNNNSSIFSFIA